MLENLIYYFHVILLKKHFYSFLFIIYINYAYISQKKLVRKLSVKCLGEAIDKGRSNCTEPLKMFCRCRPKVNIFVLLVGV
jgi:hypothetical protein